MAQEDDISGVVIATVTPFKRNGEVYREGVKELATFLSSKGVDLLFVCGTTGEGMTMTMEERKKTSEFFIEFSEIPVIVHAGTNNVSDTIELVKHSKDVGAVAVAAITPMFYPYTQEGMVTYFLTVAKSSDIPFFIYSNPARAGHKLAEETVAKIFSHGPQNLVGVKESSGDMTFLGKLIDMLPTKRIFNGADTCYLPALILGTCGQVSGPANIMPELQVELYKAWKQKDIDSARKIQKRISAVKSLLDAPAIQPIREGLKFRGIDVGDVRSPLSPMAEEEVERLRKNLSSLEPQLFPSH